VSSPGIPNQIVGKTIQGSREKTCHLIATGRNEMTETVPHEDKQKGRRKAGLS
jgi:hypothetical protein